MKPGTNKLRRRKYRRKRIKAERKAHEWDLNNWVEPVGYKRATRRERIAAARSLWQFMRGGGKVEWRSSVATYYPPGDRRRVTREQALQCIIPASEFCIEPAQRSR